MHSGRVHTAPRRSVRRVLTVGRTTSASRPLAAAAKIHDLATVNGYAKCWGFWSRTVTHDASIAQPYVCGVPSPIWPGPKPHVPDCSSRDRWQHGDEQTSAQAAKRTPSRCSTSASPPTIRPPRVAAPTRLFKEGRFGGRRLSRADGRCPGLWGVHRRLHHRRRLRCCRAHRASSHVQRYEGILQVAQEPDGPLPTHEDGSKRSGEMKTAPKRSSGE